MRGSIQSSVGSDSSGSEDVALGRATTTLRGNSEIGSRFHTVSSSEDLPVVAARSSGSEAAAPMVVDDDASRVPPPVRPDTPSADEQA